RVVLLAAAAYAVIGLVFGALANSGGAQSTTIRSAWRVAAWLASAAVFGAHIVYEQLQRRSAPSATALRAASAAGLGAFALAGAAHTGSAAVGRADRWSDIDLALCLAPDADAERVAAEWTERMYREHGAVAHHDVRVGPTLFRVFLLGNTLQVDLAFWPPNEFGATGPTFRLLFGAANERPPAR